MRSTKTGVVIMMVIMRTAPNAAGTECEESKDLHQHFGRSRTRQDRMVLLVVINDKKTQEQQPGEYAARNLTGEVVIPERSCDRADYHASRREYAPPTPCRRIHRIGPRCEYQFFTGHHACSKCDSLPKRSICRSRLCQYEAN